MNYRDRMKDLRERYNLTQKDVAELLHCTQVAYGMYERGDRKISVEKLITLAKYYGTTLDYMAGLTDVP